MPRDPEIRDRRRRRRSGRKDRLIQTRVAEDLEQTLKREAARRRLTVSHLIRNTLEDTFNLVQDVTDDVGQIVTGSVELAAAVSRDARRLADIVRGRTVDDEKPEHDEHEPRGSTPDVHSEAAQDVETALGDESRVSDPTARPEGSAPAEEQSGLDHVYGWNRVIANRAAECARCRAAIEKGDEALVGLSDDPAKARAWLCADCAEEV